MKLANVIATAAVVIGGWVMAAEPGLNTSGLNTPGQVSLDGVKLEAGMRVDLTGQWLFKPGTAVADGGDPKTDVNDAGYLTTPVPGLMTKIQWWLDDSEDFKKWEDARLKNLGFDTEKNSDGWYRMWIEAPKLEEGKHLWVEFDGVAMRSEVYINGKELGKHAGMFSRFGFDLTQGMKEGKNLLAVHVGMEGIPETDAKLGEAVTVNLSAAKVISMSKGMFGPLSVGKSNRDYDLYGIWQPVKLVVRGEDKIEDVFFNPSLTGAKIQVETLGKGKLHAKITDKKTGEVLAEADGVTKERGAILTVDNLKPKLWTPAEPNLYRLEVTLAATDGTVEDKWEHEVGFRTFVAKGNHLYLNGHPYWLRGANQLPYGKNPFSPELARKLIGELHENDVRFTRTHATPWNEAWLDAADEIGLAVSVEGIRPWAFAGKAEPEVMPPPAIFQHWLMENADVVKRVRNHPSVFILTVGNEMLLRDAKSVEKWELLSQVVKQTRELAGGLPVVCSSDYTRDPEFYDSTLKPKGLDDGDLDDMHRYFGWYAESPFVLDMKFEKELKNNKKQRPLIGQEFATGYPDLDGGLVVWKYTRDFLTSLSWVGRWGYGKVDGPGKVEARNEAGADVFLAHHRIVTKRLAERLRMDRGDGTSGFALFSAECWFKHSYDPATVAPYPVVGAAKYFWAPVGVALESAQRRFYGGDTFATNVVVTNDDEQFGDLKDLTVECRLMDGGTMAAKSDAVSAKDIPYYGQEKVGVTVKWPEVEGRKGFDLVTVVMSGGKEISRTVDGVEVFPRVMEPHYRRASEVVRGDVDLSEGSDLRKRIEGGETVVLLSPGKGLLKDFPEDIADVKTGMCEYADWSPVMGTELAKGLEPMDLKWWARRDDWKCYVASESHRLKEGGKARSLIDYMPAHSYTRADAVPALFRTVMFEIAIGKGRLWVCDLDFAASRGVDPAADLMMRNINAASNDPESTKDLPVWPVHAEIVKERN
ncbi:MAG TPA: glycoside hydrolase family 2 TIM barrel-domain containing protein [Tepidisphaeraceae bacterium]|jgi:hypothetical protein|nr:glycoside hydrolase family 2 TIM barrel-domain containing protein [Tepidisphaeraceae bacterium]